MIRFGIKVREIDRAYEKFNNQDFDNGVYHKYAYKNNSQQQKKEEDGKSDDEDDADKKKKEGERNRRDTSR